MALPDVFQRDQPEKQREQGLSDRAHRITTGKTVDKLSVHVILSVRIKLCLCKMNTKKRLLL